MDQPKIQRLLRLLMLLTGTRRYTLAELQQRFQTSERTIYRYFDTIEEAGFVVDRKDGAYRLSTETPPTKSLSNLLHFSEEEAYIFYKALSTIEGDSSIKERLICKLNSLYDFRALSQIKDKSVIEVISKLGEGIRSSKQVILYEYRSSNSHSIYDRTVEAFEFLPDYSAIWCYEKQSDTCKQFKIARIKQVEVLPYSWSYNEKHYVPFVDAFRMSANVPINNVKATLSLKAYNLLMEEFPLAENFIKPLNGKYLLDIPVADFNGIGRFVMGLLGDVQVNGPEEFVDFLKEKVKKFEVVTEVDS
jgi:proteasome accessory factor C